MGCHFPLQGILPTQGSNPGLLGLQYWQVDSLPLSHLGSSKLTQGSQRNATDTNFQFSSAQSCPTLCDPMNRSTPGLPVHHQLPEFTQTQVHQVSDTIQPSHPLSSPLFLPRVPPSIRVFSNELALCIRWPKYWSFSFSISPSNEGGAGSTPGWGAKCKPLDHQGSPPSLFFIFDWAQSSPYSFSLAI